MQQKKVPMRRCVGCAEMRPKKELVRIVRSPEGEISADLTGKKSGRGAYLCKNPACLRAAEKGKRLERALSCAIPPEIYASLAEALSAPEQ